MSLDIFNVSHLLSDRQFMLLDETAKLHFKCSRETLKHSIAMLKCCC